MTASYCAASQELCKDSDHPKERAVCEAVRLLQQQHSAYQQAVAGGQAEKPVPDPSDGSDHNDGDAEKSPSSEKSQGAKGDLPRTGASASGALGLAAILAVAGAAVKSQRRRTV